MPPVPAAVVFLGNPGKDYEKTRHNAGFQLASFWSVSKTADWQLKFKGRWAPVFLGNRKVPLLLPQTFMNVSGESVRALGDFFKVAPEDWMVVHDDIELPFGEIRVQRAGGLGGHNGLKSIRQHLATDRFFRLRIGIGRPEHGEVADHVLGRFSVTEEIQLSLLLPLAATLLEKALLEGVKP